MRLEQGRLPSTSAACWELIEAMLIAHFALLDPLGTGARGVTVVVRMQPHVRGVLAPFWAPNTAMNSLQSPAPHVQLLALI